MQRLTTEVFIAKAISKHGNTYDYSQTQYITQQDKIKIICPIHGVFEQHPHNHLKGHGCAMCSGNFKKTTKMYIEDVKKVHGDIYDYSKLDYVNIDADVLIICKKHGEFAQRALHHLHGSGCPVCCNSKGENIIRNWLKIHNIQYISEHRFKLCKDKTPLPFDFYLPQYNMCIEYDGEQHFKPTQFRGSNVNLKECQRRDNIKTDYCEVNGIKLLRIPYTEFNNIEYILENEMGS
jgi:very-short-patch-repair endonuclease